MKINASISVILPVALLAVAIGVKPALSTARAEEVSPSSSLRILQGPEVCKDAHINAAHPRRNTGANSTFGVHRSNVPIHGLIKFDLSKLPKDRAVKDVAVMLFMKNEYYGPSCNPMVVEAYAVGADWREREVSWLNRTRDQKWQRAGGDCDRKHLLATFDVPSFFGRGWILLKGRPLTRLVNLWIKGQKPNYGLILRAKSEPGGPSIKNFVSSDSREGQYQANKPKLIISYDEYINPADHGYISEAELARRPLRERLNRIADSAKHPGAELKDKMESLAGEIERITAAGDARNKTLEKKLDGLRIDLMRELWPGKEIVVWPISPWEKLSQDQIPRAGSAALSTRMLQNEYQELSLAVTNISNRDQTLDVGLSVLDDYPAEKLTLRASYWILGKAQSRLRGEDLPIWVDDVLPKLDHDKVLRLKAGQTRRLWLTVNSNDVKDGAYRFDLKIVSKTKTNEPIAEIPVQVQVLPVSLLKDKEVSVHTYAYLNRPSTAKHKAFAVKDLKEHYQNTFILNIVPTPNTDKDGNIVDRPNYSPITEQLRLMRDAKMVIFYWHECSTPHFQAALPWMSAPYKKALRSWLTDWVKVLREEGFDYDRFAMYPFDETYDNPVKGGRPEYQALEEVAREIHKVDPRIQVFCNPVSCRPEDQEWLTKLSDDIAVWSVHRLMLEPGDHTTGWPHNFSEADKQRILRDFFAKEQESGKPVWAFQCRGRTKTQDVNAYYRRWPWQLWYAGLTGIGLWSYNDIRGQSGWHESDGEDFSVIYELRDAPADIPRQPFEPILPSRRWQAWRAGIQDYFLLQQVKKSRPDLYPQMKQLAKDILQDPSNHAMYEQAREKLIDYLLTSK